jgi:hypothetical protein
MFHTDYKRKKVFSTLMSNYFNNPFLAAIGFPTRISFDKFCEDYVDEARKLNLVLKKGTDSMITQCKAIITPIKERILEAEKGRKERAKVEKLQFLIEEKKKTDEQHQKELAQARKQAVEEYKRKTSPIVISSPRKIEIGPSNPWIKSKPIQAAPPPSGTISCKTCRMKDLENAKLKETINELKASLTKRDFEIAILKETMTELEEEKLHLEQDLETYQEGFADFTNVIKRKRIQ